MKSIKVEILITRDSIFINGEEIKYQEVDDIRITGEDRKAMDEFIENGGSG